MLTTTIKTLAATTAIYTGLALAPAQGAQAALTPGGGQLTLPAAPAPRTTSREAAAATRTILSTTAELLDTEHVHVQCGPPASSGWVLCRFRISGKRQTMRGTMAVRDAGSDYVMRITHVEVTAR